MKVLRKMLLINWHYFHLEELHFDRINFLTGQNAAGKSTLIDALQVVLLGETSSSVFNKAANEKSERTIKGYLRGEMEDDGEAGYRYLRTGNFSSYIVLEFQDDVKNASFSAGAVFDAMEDGNHHYRFFIFDGKIPDHRFVQNDIPMNIEALRRFLKQRYDKKHQWPDSNRAYREALAAKLGSLKHKYFSLLKKAVPFSPISDIEKFITEYVCDVRSRIEIQDIRENLRQYKKLEHVATEIEARIRQLEKIEAQYNEVTQLSERIHVQGYIIERAELQVLLGKIDASRSEKASVEKRLGSLAADLKTLEGELEGLKASHDQCVAEKANSDLQKKYDALTQEINASKARLETGMREVERVQRNLKAYGAKWSTAIEAFGERSEPFGLIEQSGFDLNPVRKIAAALRKPVRELLEGSSTQDLKALFEGVSQLRSEAGPLSHGLDQEVQNRQEEVREIRRRLDDLKQGIKPYSAKLLELKQLLASELAKKAGRPVAVSILADELEVGNETWKKAVEAYLHTQKFNLLVEPGFFQEAIELYDRYKTEKALYDIGLVDVEKIMGLNPQPLSGSLAEEVTSESPAALAYARYLLGRVMKCDQVRQLRQYETAITPECMLYKGFVARQLHPSRWQNPFIGRRAIQEQIASYEAQLGQEMDRLERLKALQAVMSSLAGLEILSRNEYEEAVERLEGLGALRALEREIEGLVQERNGLDLTWLSKMEERIRRYSEEIHQKNLARDQILGQKGRLEGVLEQLIQVRIPEETHQAEVAGNRISERYDEVFVTEMGNPRFEQELRDKKPEIIRENFQRSRKGHESLKEAAVRALQTLRIDYNRNYRMSHDSLSEDNAEYAKALEELRQNRLPEYVEKIIAAREKTYYEFRDEFLAKLKGSFDEVTSQINELNDAIRTSSFGNDRYRFTVKPKPEYKAYYDMIMDPLLLQAGHNIFSAAFREKHGTAIEELFKNIIEVDEHVSADAQAELERNIKLFTDYRTYLNFDLLVTDASGEKKQRLSKTLLKKSGGETQTPFYISVLASFAQLYRVNQTGAMSNTARLIIFDEAFSKMDGQRIRESLALLKRFKLQAIISAPPDKIPEITPFVEKSLCVMRMEDHAFVRAFTREEVMES